MRRLVIVALLAPLLAGCGATTKPATNVTPTSAKLHADVTWSQGEQGTYWFEYRKLGAPTWTETQRNSWGPMGSAQTTPVDLAQDVTGLDSSSGYQFRLCGFLTTTGTWCFDSAGGSGTNYSGFQTTGGCDRNADPSTLAAEVSAATAGQIVCLAAGNYGTWAGTAKAITLKGTSGSLMQFNFGAGDSGFTVDGVQGAQGTIGGGSQITIRNSVFNDELNIQGGSDILLDANQHLNIDASPGEVPGRVFVQTPGVTIRDSLFQGGDADGVHSGSSVNLINNRFVNVCDGPGDNHTDMVQFNADNAGGLIKGNLFYGSATCATQGLTSYDSGTNGMVLEDNVVDIRRPWGIEWYSDQNSIIRHNTVVFYPDSGCDFTGITCGQIHITAKTADPPGVGTQVYDNVALVGVGPRATAARNDHNVQGAGVTFVGPLDSWAGYHLAPGSLGKNAASDGLDVGIR